ncbi:hypothetical protein Tco_0630601 [Tanacetum coccineum]
MERKQNQIQPGVMQDLRLLNTYGFNLSKFLKGIPPKQRQELMSKLLEDVRNISEELSEYINCPSWDRPIFYDNDDDEYTIIYSKPKAITPDLPIEEPDNSLIMGNEHLDTIPSVENLVLIPSEFEGISNDTCDVPVCEDSSPFDALNDHSEILSDSNDDGTSSDDDDFEDIEYVILEEFEPDQGGLTSVVMDEISDNSTNDPLLELPEFESFHFDLSFPRPPPKPLDVEICLNFEPDADMINNFDELNEDECFDPGGRRFGYQGIVDKKKDVIQYPRFTKLIVADLMKKFPSIPQILDEDYHSIKDDIPLICATDDYKEHETMFFGVEVPMNQPQPVVSTQGTHMTKPRAHKTPTLTAASPQGKKRKQSRDEIAEETLLSLALHRTAIAAEAQENVAKVQEKLAEEEIEKMVEGDEDKESYASEFADSMLNDDFDDFGTRIEPGSHKENPKVFDDDDVNDKEKQDESKDNNVEKIDDAAKEKDNDDHTNHTLVRTHVTGSIETDKYRYNSKITRNLRQTPHTQNTGHEKRKSTREAKDSKPKPKKFKSQSR